MVLTYKFHDYDDEKNNGYLFYDNFHDMNVKFYHPKRLKILNHFKNNYAYVDTMIIKYNYNMY
jgi:hypothetical protein